MRKTRPLLDLFYLAPFGVLGAKAGEEDPAPNVGLACVVVDPAGFNFVGLENRPKGAGGASRSIYEWLQIRETAFPDEVHGYF